MQDIGPKIEEGIKEKIDQYTDSLPEKICVGVLYVAGAALFEKKVEFGDGFTFKNNLKINYNFSYDFETGEKKIETSIHFKF